jgi:hypothetical protein
MPANGSRDSRAVVSLLRELAGGSAELVRNEVKLARIEFAAIAQALGTGTAAVAAGGVFALLGTLAVFSGLIFLAGDQWMRDRYWLAALTVTVLIGGTAAFFAKRGLALLSPRQLVPDQTMATLREDKEWVKQQLTSGATSR